MRRTQLKPLVSILLALSVAGCADDDGGGADTETAGTTEAADETGDPNPTTGPTGTSTTEPDETGGSDETGPVAMGPCIDYCDILDTNCTGDNAQYADYDECVSYCMGANWPEGETTDMAGNTIGCRIYHGGDPAAADPAFHCPHAGPSGMDVCGSVDFRSDDAAEYDRVDRMGMPAVSTALVGTDTKNDYNDANPSQDAALTFAVELIANLTGLHDALDDDLIDAGLTPCSMTDIVSVNGLDLPACVGQNVAAGVPVVSLVVPDTLSIDQSAPAGFPNGRGLADPVIDVTLSVILLELTSGVCGDGACSPVTLVGLNHPANDVDFLAEFPYLAPPATP